jgi:hypothetical protein
MLQALPAVALAKAGCWVQVFILEVQFNFIFL